MKTVKRLTPPKRKSPAQIQRMWRQAIHRRRAEILFGKAKLIPAENALQNALRAISRPLI